MKNSYPDPGAIQWFVMGVQGWDLGATRLDSEIRHTVGRERGMERYEKSFDRVLTAWFRLGVCTKSYKLRQLLRGQFLLEFDEGKESRPFSSRHINLSIIVVW